MAKEKDDSSKKKKVKSFKEFDPSQYINVEPVIAEAARGKTAVLTFGRMNPITVGHEKLVNSLIQNAASRKGAVPMVYLSHSQDPRKNPLSYEDKVKFAKQAFGNIIKQSKARTIIEVMKELDGKYENVIVVVGSDRAGEFHQLLNKYNGKEYNFESIKIVSAGQRDPDADSVEGMSASKMRKYASSNDLNNFTKGLPKKLKSSAEQIMSDVKKGMNEEVSIHEEDDLQERQPLSIQQRRKRALQMKRLKTKIKIGRERAKKKMASKEKLQKRARKKALEFIRNRLMKQKKYSEMTPSEKIALDKRVQKINPKVLDRIAKRLFPKVRAAEKERLKSVMNKKTEDTNEMFEAFLLERDTTSSKPQDPDVKDRPGSQPKGYYKGVAKDKKDARAAHFERGAKMDDDNPAAYKPAPGDKEAKTKPSVHTKKFKDMFGEMNEAYKADMTVRKRPHMALEKNGSVKIDKRFKIFKSKEDMNESYEDLNEDLVNLMLDMDSFIMSEEFDNLMESDPKEALKKKAEKTGISYGILKKVFDRGVAAWRTGHRPGTNPTQWGLARVNSFATKGKGTWGKADKDLAAKVRKEEVELDEATAMTAGPKGSLGGIGKKPSMPAPGKKSDMPAPKDSKKINAPKGTARYHADMAAKHQQAAQHHERRASEHEDEGNDDKADHHYDKMQHHDNAADAHKHAQDMIKKHGADHPEAQKASKEANKHKLGESVELDEGIIKPYHAIGKQPWSKTVKDSKGTAGEYKQIAKGKDFTVWFAYRGSSKSYPHYVVKDDKIIGSGMAFRSALKDAGLTDKDITHRSKFAVGSPLNKGMKESVELDENMSRVAKELETYARKYGGIDKMDFMKAAMMMKKGQTGQLKKFVDDLDTEPREKILSLMQKDADRRKEYKAFQKAKRNENLDEAKTDIYHKHMLKALGKSRLPKNHSYTSMIANNGDFVVKDGGGRTVGRIAKGDHNLKEAAPKIGVDSLKQIRDQDRKHNAAMGRTATGRKKPAARVSSTKKSLADIRKRAEKYKKEEINLSTQEENIFEANEQTLNTLLEKIHNHVLDGKDYNQIIEEITTLGDFGWSSRELKEFYVEKYNETNEDDNINKTFAAMYEKYVAEGERTAIAKERIAREKARDKIKHTQMIARAKVRDLRSEDTPSDREWGTDNLTSKYKKDTPGQDD